MQEELTVVETVTDAETYRWVALVLRAGLYLSLAAMIGGLVWWLLSGAGGGGDAARKTLPLNAVISQLLAGNPLALLNLGVLLLLATPGVTLLTAFLTYLGVRNWRYVGITALVGAILLLSLSLSLLGFDKVIQGWVQSLVGGR